MEEELPAVPDIVTLYWRLQEENERLRRENEELKERIEELERLIRYDRFLGVLNKVSFEEALKSELNRAERLAERNIEVPLSLAIIDIDDFKQINDRYGHPVGDEALKHVGGIIRNNVRNYDKVGRIGGEEFAIIFPDTPKEGAYTACERLRRKIEATPFRYNGAIYIPITISCGIATYPKDGEDRLTLYECADLALRVAKQRGKNRVVVYHPQLKV